MSKNSRLPAEVQEYLLRVVRMTTKDKRRAMELAAYTVRPAGDSSLVNPYPQRIGKYAHIVWSAEDNDGEYRSHIRVFRATFDHKSGKVLMDRPQCCYRTDRLPKYDPTDMAKGRLHIARHGGLINLAMQMTIRARNGFSNRQRLPTIPTMTQVYHGFAGMPLMQDTIPLRKQLARRLRRDLQFVDDMPESMLEDQLTTIWAQEIVAPPTKDFNNTKYWLVPHQYAIKTSDVLATFEVLPEAAIGAYTHNPVHKMGRVRVKNTALAAYEALNIKPNPEEIGHNQVAQLVTVMRSHLGEVSVMFTDNDICEALARPESNYMLVASRNLADLPEEVQYRILKSRMSKYDARGVVAADLQYALANPDERTIVSSRTPMLQLFRVISNESFKINPARDASADDRYCVYLGRGSYRKRIRETV